jgi:hypothetical protein
MLPVGFEPTIPASARPQTYVIDRAATAIDAIVLLHMQLRSNKHAGLTESMTALIVLMTCDRHGLSSLP